MTGAATGGAVGATGVFAQLAARAPARHAMPSRAAWSVLVKPYWSLNFGTSDLKLYRKRRATSKATHPLRADSERSRGSVTSARFPYGGSHLSVVSFSANNLESRGTTDSELATQT